MLWIRRNQYNCTTLDKAASSIRFLWHRLGTTHNGGPVQNAQSDPFPIRLCPRTGIVSEPQVVRDQKSPGCHCMRRPMSSRRASISRESSSCRGRGGNMCCCCRRELLTAPSLSSSDGCVSSGNSSSSSHPLTKGSPQWNSMVGSWLGRKGCW